MSKVPGNYILEELLKSNEKVLAAVYKNVFTQMERLGVKLKTTPTNVKESVQDAFEIFYRKLLDGNLELNCTVETYIISIAKRILLKNMEHWFIQKRNDLMFNFDIVEEEPEVEINDKIIIEKKEEIFRIIFKTLGKECQQIILLTIEGYSIAEIMKTMNIVSESAARTQKMKCKSYLIMKIKENPDYEKLRNANPEDFELHKW